MTTTEITAGYANDENRLFHGARDTGIRFVRFSNHHWELHDRTDTTIAVFMDYARAFVAACGRDRAARSLGIVAAD